MKIKGFKPVLSLGLAAMLFFASAGQPLAVGSTTAAPAPGAVGSAEVRSKDEVIYALLSSDGSVQSMYAVNHFEIAQAGEIIDYGDYTSVLNLTDTAPLTQEGGAVMARASAESFYYQGNMAVADLPWIFELSYFLDGVALDAKELAGKAGQLEIQIATRQNTAVNPAFYDNYLLQISITLDTEKCSSIQAPGAAVASAGKNKMIVYTVMPGKDAAIQLSAAVKDFAMAGIDISAMPFSMSVEAPNTEDVMEDFAQLSDAISDLNDGVGRLADGAAQLQTGTDKMRSGSWDIKDGLSKLSDNSASLLQASSQIGGALTQISSSLNGASPGMDLSGLAQLPEGLSQLAAGLDGMSGGLAELKDGFTQAYGALEGAIQGIPDAAISLEQIADLYSSSDPSLHGTLDQLLASYKAGQVVKGTFAGVKGAFDAMDPTLDSLVGSIDKISTTLNQMSAQIGGMLSGMDILEQLSRLSAGLSELNQNYAAFHNGLKGYTNGVDELSSGYKDFHRGLSSFRNGVGELTDGMNELHDGTKELDAETSKIPDRIQSEIDGLLDQYTGSDFQPISFVSPRNSHTSLVQFVLKCDGVEAPKETKDAQAWADHNTFWDRLAALFRRDKQS